MLHTFNLNDVVNCEPLTILCAVAKESRNHLVKEELDLVLHQVVLKTDPEDDVGKVKLENDKGVSSNVLKTTENALLFVDPGDASDYSTSSIQIEDTDPLCNLKQEPQSCSTAAKQCTEDLSIKNDSCVSDVPCSSVRHVGPQRLDHLIVPQEPTINAHHLLDEGMLKSRSSNVSSSFPLHLNTGILQDVSSADNCTKETIDSHLYPMDAYSQWRSGYSPPESPDFLGFDDATQGQAEVSLKCADGLLDMDLSCSRVSQKIGLNEATRNGFSFPKQLNTPVMRSCYVHLKRLITSKTEPESDNKAELQSSIHMSLAQSMCSTEQEAIQFVEPADVHGTSKPSVHVDEIDPLSDLKHEPDSCFVDAQESRMDGAIKNSSCLSELLKPPTIRPCFVHLVRLDIAGHLPVNIHQLFDAGPLQSQSSDAVLLKAECSDVRTVQGVPSGTQSNMQVFIKDDDGPDFIRSATIQDASVGHLQCEQFQKTHRHSAYNSVPLTGKMCDSKKSISFQKAFINKDHLVRNCDMHVTNHRDQYLHSEKQFKHDRKFNARLQIHTGECGYMCFHCEKYFIHKSALKIHIRLHTGERPYRCSQCEKVFTNNSGLRSHMKVHSGERPYHCSECNKAFSHNNNLKAHMSSHSGERPYKCSQCGKDFKDKRYLRIHMKYHTGERPYQCSHCGKVFTLSQELKSHIRCHTGDRPYPCSLCDKAFRHNSSLRIHMRYHTGERPYQCSQCAKAFTQIGHLKEHMRLHSGVRTFQCSHCEKAFMQKCTMETHMRCHTGERPFKCSQCNKTFIQIGHLKEHINLHSGERPYHCSHCDKSFTTKSNLYIHMRFHTGERRYQCSECDKAFAYNSNLKTHFRLHSGERPYRCSQCEKAFADSSYLKTHMRTHTGERPYKCSHCDKSFTQISPLKKHIRFHCH